MMTNGIDICAMMEPIFWQAMAPLPGVQQLQGDITKLATANKYYSM